MAQKPKQPRISVSIATPEQVVGAPEDSILWAPQPGPQTIAMLRPEFEIFYGGAKGGGKSFSIIGFMMKGNPEVPLDKATPVDISYLNCPTYRALVLRKNLGDLESWIAEAGRIYGTDGRSGLGANYTQKPNEFTFPSGAKVIMGHLDDDKAVEKYFGNVVHRAAIDELTFIDSFRNYMRLVSCVRSNVKGIRPQIFSTGNPGGPGTPWVMDRFVEPKDDDGNIYPPLTPIVQEFWNPYTKTTEKKTRIFIPSKLKDNPKLLASDPGYYTTLAMMPEAERRAYLEGDWRSLGGTFFPEFRAKALEAEPGSPCHVISPGSVQLPGWAPVFAACDWGFGHNAAVGKAKKLGERVIIHGEYVAAGVGSVELGNQIARMLLPDLNALKSAGSKPTITLWLSPDAFGKRDQYKTPAEGIAEGIGRVIGSNAVHLPELFGKSSTDFEGSFFAEQQFQSDAGITIKKAQNARIAGAAHMREMLRWKQIAQSPKESFDPEIAARLLHENADKWRKYVNAYKAREPEALPKLLIESDCRQIIQMFLSVVSDPDNIEDVLKTEALSDDVYDMCRYMLHSESVSEAREPQQAFVQRHLSSVRQADPNIDYNSLVWASRWAESEYGKSDNLTEPFSMPMESNRHFRNRRLQ